MYIFIDCHFQKYKDYKILKGLEAKFLANSIIKIKLASLTCKQK